MRARQFWWAWPLQLMLIIIETLNTLIKQKLINNNKFINRNSLLTTAGLLTINVLTSNITSVSVIPRTALSSGGTDK